MTWTTRFFHWLLVCLLAGPLASSAWGHTRVESSVRAGAQVLEEWQGVMAENPVWGSFDLKVRYTYGQDLVKQDRVVSSVAPDTADYYGYDGLGSVRVLIQGSGQSWAFGDTYVYDAFGIQLNTPGSTPNNYRYTGEQWDPDLGLYYLRARYYNPADGRFLTMDTFEGNNSDPLSLHKYLYCQDNPVNGTDPTGHDLNAGSMAGSMAGRSGLATTSSSTIGRALVTSRNLIGRSMVQATRLRVGDPTEYLMARLWGGAVVAGMAEVGLGLGLAFEDSEETKGRVLYRGMSGESMPDLLPEGETEAGKYLGIRPKDIKDVQNGTVMPTAQGLSVTPNNPSLMHPFIRGKIAEGKARVWGIYEGLLDPRLMVRPDPENLKGHAFIGVAAPMSVAEFKRLIAETQRMWSQLSP